MRKLFFMLAFVLIASMSFAINGVETKLEKELVVKIEKSTLDGVEIITEFKTLGKEIVCTRTCFYQGGTLLGCTEWKCVEIATEQLPEIVIGG
jgi:hypothetical protein